MSVVAVTGINGFFAKSIVQRLEADPDIERIVGVDVAPSDATSEKTDFHRLDIRDPGLARIFDGVETVVHLAFIVAEIHDKRRTHEINVGGTRNVLDACATAKVRKVVVASSVAAYGSHATNPIGMTEEQALVANPDSYYSVDKVEVEKMLAEFSRSHPEIVVTILRPPIVVGPGAEFLKNSIGAQTRFAVRGRDPQVQWLHEEDLGDAFHRAIEQDLRGAFNVAPDDSMSMSRCFEMFEAKPLRLPAWLLKGMANLLFALRILNVSRGWVSLGEHSCVMSNEKLKKVSGWRPRFTSEAALQELVASMRDG